MTIPTSRAWTPGIALTLAWAIPSECRARRSRALPPPSTRLYRQLPWRYIGPEGNRVSAVAGVPGDSLVYYAGAASGGIFKITDGGVDWQPIVHPVGTRP